jgi:hypothetical protein
VDERRLGVLSVVVEVTLTAPEVRVPPTAIEVPVREIVTVGRLEDDAAELAPPVMRSPAVAVSATASAKTRFMWSLLVFDGRRPPRS